MAQKSSMAHDTSYGITNCIPGGQQPELHNKMEARMRDVRSATGQATVDQPCRRSNSTVNPLPVIRTRRVKFGSSLQ